MDEERLAGLAKAKAEKAKRGPDAGAEVVGLATAGQRSANRRSGRFSGDVKRVEGGDDGEEGGEQGGEVEVPATDP